MSPHRGIGQDTTDLARGAPCEVDACFVSDQMEEGFPVFFETSVTRDIDNLMKINYHFMLILLLEAFHVRSRTDRWQRV